MTEGCKERVGVVWGVQRVHEEDAITRNYPVCDGRRIEALHVFTRTRVTCEQITLKTLKLCSIHACVDG